MHELDNRLRFERLLADLSARFANIPVEEIDAEIEEAQRRVAFLICLTTSVAMVDSSLQSAITSVGEADADFQAQG